MARIEPIAWVESPNQAIRRNCAYKVTAPRSVAWSVNLYAGPEVAALVRELRDALAYHVEQTRPIERTSQAIAAADEFLQDEEQK